MAKPVNAEAERKALMEAVERKRLIEAVERKRAEEAKGVDVAGASLAGLQQLGRSTSFGLADVAGAGLDVLADKLTPKSEVDKQLEAQGFKIEQPELTYEQALKSRRQLEQAQREEFPIATKTGDIAGMLVGGTGVGKAFMKGAQKVAPRLVAKAAEKGALALGARTALAGAEGAAQGAAYGAIPAIEGRGDIGEEMRQGAVISAAFPVAGAVLRGAKNVAGVTIRSAFGIKPDIAAKYLARPEEIRAAKSVPELVTIIDDAASKIRNEFESAQASRKKAEEAFDVIRKNILEEFKGSKIEAKRALEAAKQNLDTAFMAEKEMLKKVPPPVQMIDEVLDSNKKIKDRLIEESNKATAMLSATDAGEAASNRVKITAVNSNESRFGDITLKTEWPDSLKKLAGGYEKAFTVRAIKNGKEIGKTDIAYRGPGSISFEDIWVNDENRRKGVAAAMVEHAKRLSKATKLEEPGGGFSPEGKKLFLSLTSAPKKHSAAKIARKPILDLLKEEVKALRQSVGETDNAAAAQIEPYIERFQKQPELISLEEAKKILKQLDKDINYNYDSGAFNESKDLVLKNIRSAINKTLGDMNEGYREYMETVVQPLAELRAQASKAYGTPEKIRAKLLRLDKPELEAERSLLRKMAEETGKDFDAPLMEYQRAKAVLQSPLALEGVKGALPEAREVAKAQAKYSQAQRTSQDILEKRAQASREYAMMQQAKEAERAKAELFENVRAFSNGTTEAKVKSLMSARDNVELNRKLLELSKMSGQDFRQMVDDARVKAAFDKEFTAGSRNVNFWALIASGGASGGIMAGPLGMALGATFGAITDKYGPKIAQGVLDGYLMIKGIPTVHKISKAMNSLPPDLKNEMIDGFRRTFTQGIVQDDMEVPPASVPFVRADIEASDLPDTDKAKMISELNRTGRLTKVSRLMLGAHKPVQKMVMEPVVVTPKPSVKDLTDQIKTRREQDF